LKFVDAILSSSHGNPFTRDFETFQKKISYFGIFNSLSQILLKMTCPGIPDVYQGTEIWDFSLVDPDNRRPVDFDRRKEMLHRLKMKIAMSGSDRPGFVRALFENWREGYPKLYLTLESLNYRKENYPLFMDGIYIPLVGEGDLQDHVCAFARQKQGKVVLVIVPRFLTRLIQSLEDLPFGKNVWGDSGIVIPDEIAGDKFRNIFTGESLQMIQKDTQRV
jgi:(1->4)-alpha-D-glucan 1-alpha-D-glucosylmutase